MKIRSRSSSGQGDPPGVRPLARKLAWAGLVLMTVLQIVPQAQEAPQQTATPETTALKRERAKTGISQRVPWTNFQVIGSPDPASPYLVRRVLPNLKFKDPVDLCGAPGSDRWFLAEQAGRIYSFANDPGVSRPDLFFDLGAAVPGVNALYGITFHPGFATNRYVYLCYVLKDGVPDGSRVSRFVVSATDPPKADPASEKIIITWISGGHNGGCIKFGPDNYLYLATGDGAGPDPPDPLQTGQDNRDLLSTIVRIDVDSPTPDRPYRVPKDNPFLDRADSRPEIWAYGLRNPWRMSFDAKTGALWVADVGWELWEMVYRVERGGNYGWSIVEGPQPVHPDSLRGPTPILPPVKAHGHAEAASITGGCVYYGRQLPDLVGAYIYGDWVTGKIWALHSDTNNLASVEELVDTSLQVVSFAVDPLGELYVLDYAGGIYQLERNRNPSNHLSFPRALSETGLFATVKDHRLAGGVLPFQINAEMWADHASADRFIGLPHATAIQTGARNAWLNQTKNDWRYPTNAVLAKTLSIEMEKGNPASTRRLETQILHFDGLDWHGYTYRWNEAQTDATLLPAVGDETVLDIKDANAPGGHRQQTWRFHSRTECMRCHNPWVNAALAFTAPQLNRDLSYQADLPVTDRPTQPGPGVPNPPPGPTANQLRTFAHIGYFDAPLDERARPRFTDPYATGANINERARAWLHINCSHCHREGAGGSIVSHFDYDTRPRNMKAIGRRPSQGSLGLAAASVISPGAPGRSVLYYRVATTGQGHMPLIGSKQTDTRGLKLLHDWIQQLPASLSQDPIEEPPGDLQAAIVKASQCLNTSVSPSAEVNAAFDSLLATPTGALTLLSVLNDGAAPRSCPSEVLEKIARHPSFQVRELFERFLPDELRPKKLGATLKPDELLALRGDAAKGRALFFREGVQCAQCHRVQGQGRDFGPDLSQIGRKYSRSQLLDQILNPSKSIDAAFVNYEVETKQDAAYTGFVLKRTSEEIILKDTNLNQIRLAPDQIQLIRPLQLSVMPEGLLQNLTAAEAADLLEFLHSLQ